ncbi:VanZ like family protein [Chryseobacterium oranimense G311]|uniref:VanZ family protein n=1 Tax=Chryseobacterium oranimense TaxID=421058 RepID=UPI000533B673|nr:VanZ family protein [Chryseobacterium oranimense]CEJ71183.1 VanZ like family protein [Chryseobacterium oranimense G311]
MGRSQYEDNQITVEPVLSTIKFIHNTIELKYIVIIVFGNIIMFMPFGFLGWILPGLKDLKALLYTFVSSIIIVEALQYFTRMGIFEVDDIILNTFGVYLGWLLREFIEKRFKSLLI